MSTATSHPGGGAGAGRAASAIHWHPEGSRFAVAYCSRAFPSGGAAVAVETAATGGGMGLPPGTALSNATTAQPPPLSTTATTTTAARPRRVAPAAYIWDCDRPIVPAAELTPPSPLVCIRFNPKTPDILVGGCANGLLALFDARKPRGGCLVSVSAVESGHADPVTDVHWVQSKTNSQVVSVSTGACGAAGC